MRRVFRPGLAVLCFALVSLRGWGQQEVFVPGKDATGYSFSKTDAKVDAPEGYVGDHFPGIILMPGSYFAERPKKAGHGRRDIAAVARKPAGSGSVSRLRFDQPTAIAMMPATIAVAAASRLARSPSPSSRLPSSTPNRTLTSRAGATALTAVKRSAVRTRM